MTEPNAQYRSRPPGPDRRSKRQNTWFPRILLTGLMGLCLAGTGRAQDTTGLSTLADSLIAASRQRYDHRQFGEALNLVQAAVDTLQPWKDQLPEVLASCLFNRGRTLYSMDRKTEAEQDLLAAQNLQEGCSSDVREDLATTLNLLGVLYKTDGRFTKAEPYYLRSLGLRKDALGDHHPDYLTSLNNLGDFYFRTGDYRQAEKYDLLALQGRKATLPTGHKDVVWSLVNLAILYNQMGLTQRAEALYREALSFDPIPMGPKAIEIAIFENNLANLYLRIRQYPEAISRYQEALPVFRQVLGDRHEYTARLLNNLGHAMEETGQFAVADSLYNQALSIWGDKLGRDHPSYAQGLNNLGEVSRKTGHLAEAKSLLEEALRIRTDRLGDHHPDVASSHLSLAKMFWAMGDMKAAGTHLQEAARIQQGLLADACLFLTEEEQVQFVQRFRENLDQFYSFASLQADPPGEWAGRSLDLSLFYKGMVLDATHRWTARARKDPRSGGIYTQWIEAKAALAQELSKPLDQRQDLRELEDKAHTLEKTLTTLSGEPDQPVHWTEVREALAPGEAVLDIVEYEVWDPEPTGQRRIAGLLLRHGDTGPSWIPICDAAALDALVFTNKNRKADYVNELYAWPDRGLVQDIEPGHTLRELVWDPIASSLEGIRTLYYVPSGILHRINLPAVAVSEDEVVADRIQVVRLTNPRQVVRKSDPPVERPDAMIWGGIDYNAVGDSLSRTAEDMATRSADAEPDGGWPYLRWTQVEADRVTGIWTSQAFPVHELTGADAGEDVFKKIGEGGQPSPAVLHLATHGYFFADPSTTGQVERQDVHERAFQWSEDPMIRSGLLLSGANHAWLTGQPRTEGEEDGILTAYEISQVDLSGTDLVVLSACETGLGDIRGDEGVYGLQRAFKIAGARYLIMSLWQVPDRQTMQFMTTFYENWLNVEGSGRRMTIPDAFHKTQREMRDRFFDPYAWAGFVLIE